jgi:hypothetical protein
MAPALNWDDLSQRPALPLGSWLKTDPWDDKVHQLNAKIYAYMNPRDKMPFELTPIFFKLQRYDASRLAPSVPALATPTPPAASAPPAAPPTAPETAPPATSEAAPTTTPPAGSDAAPPAAPPAAQPAPADAPQQLTGTSNPPQQ